MKNIAHRLDIYDIFKRNNFRTKNNFPEFGLIKSKFYELIYDIDFIGKKVMVKDLTQSILA